MRLKLPLIILVVLILTNIGLAVFLLSGNKKSKKIEFLCPLPKEYCSSGKVIKFDNHYFGIGYKVPAEVPIRAIVSGQVKGGRVTYSSKLGSGKFPTILINSTNKAYEITYVLTGGDYQNLVDVKAGETLDKTREGEIAKFGVNLLVIIDTFKNGQSETLNLKPGDLKPR